MSFFSSIEFYTIMAVVAAAIVALAARPRSRQTIKEYLLASRLHEVFDDGESDNEPSIEFVCGADGGVRLYRRGLTGVSMSGAVSLAVRSDGVDVRFEERLVGGNAYDMLAAEAVFDIDFMPQGWYNVQYNSDSTGLFVAFRLHVRPGIKALRLLGQ